MQRVALVHGDLRASGIPTYPFLPPPALDLQRSTLSLCPLAGLHRTDKTKGRWWVKEKDGDQLDGHTKKSSKGKAGREGREELSWPCK
mmetsp:Transcript_37547/g.118432  ORF Transcript_37547/g.118432 Transcript_37547/m.118432 type:complete len:88 (+) Transcript_37547:1349-1612(+)